MSEEDRITLGAHLKREREYRGFSQEEVAKYLGISRSAVSLTEKGSRKLDIFELRKLCKLYECNIEDLTGAKRPEEPESVGMVARAAAALSPEDRSEVLRFAQFLQSRKDSKPE